MHRTLLASAFLSFACTALSAAEVPVDYARQIKPIFSRHCYECHGEKLQKGDFRADSAKELLKGGENGEAFIPGKAAESLLIDMIKGAPGVLRMPHKRTPLSDAEVDLLVKWVDQGAKLPVDEKADQAHWAFQPPVRAALPVVKNKMWVRNEIDDFVLAHLEKVGLKPSAEADRATLIRRLYLDILGLPPTIDEVDAFVNDARPDAYDRLIDHVLASPHYGERWGRHWLDAARYADSNGFTIDSPREIWKYRDWVIDAINRDLPFNQFVIEQVAGDMLPNATQAQKIATGFHRNTLVNQEGGIDAEQFRVEAVADRVSTTGLVFLGLTLNCARCHDHKYDPIKQSEYYQLFAFLNNQSEPTLSIATPEIVARREAAVAEMEKLEEGMDPALRQFIKSLPEAEQEKLQDTVSLILNLRPDQRTDDQKKTLATYFRKMPQFKKGFDQLDVVKKKLPQFPTTLVLQEMPKGRETHVHIKGDFTRKGERVLPGVLSVLHPLPPVKNPNRLDLAKWLVDPRNPLVGRVTVNRVWQAYFNKGLVETENDFGTQGAEPTHPELLDWLANELIARNWSMKALHRLIVSSATYRQSSKFRADLAKVDPYNKLLGRQERFRLDAEIVRDNALAVSGFLSRKMGGPSVYPPQPEGVYAFTQVKRAWDTSAGPDRYRRGIYTFFQRSAPYPSLIVFDAPDGNSACTRRVRSNTPLQALTLLNDEAFLDLARGVAERVRAATASDDERVRYAFRLCMAREPKAAEAKLLEGYLQQQLQSYAAAPKDALALLKIPANTAPQDMNEATERAAWMTVARVLLNLDEFITRE